MSWLFFAVTTYAFYSVTNFIEKFLVEKKIKHATTLIIASSSLSVIVGIVLLAIRGFQMLPFIQLFLLFLSGIFLTAYILPYLKALSLDDASRVVPLFQFFPIFVLIISYIFLHEHLNTFELIGFVFITIGGFMLGAEKLEKGLFKLRKSFWYMMIASFLYGMTGILFKYINNHDFWLTLGYQTFFTGVSGVAFIFYPRYRKDFLEELPVLRGNILSLLTLNQSLALIAEFCNFYAITLAPVSLVSSIQGVQPIFLLVYGLILSLWFPHIIKEDIRKSTILLKLLSMIIIFAGLYLISLR